MTRERKGEERERQRDGGREMGKTEREILGERQEVGRERGKELDREPDEPPR